MNIVFRIAGGDEAVEKEFANGAAAAHLVGTPGHRSVGGMRISLYNAVGQDSVEALNDTLKSVFISTDFKSYKILSSYLYEANFKIRPMLGGKVEFGTFKIIEDNKRYYVPDVSITKYLKKMIEYLNKKKADPQLVQAITDNYPWVFNP